MKTSFSSRLPLLALILVFFLLSACVTRQGVVLRIPQETLEAKLAERLPVTGSFLSVFRLRLENPRIRLDAGSGRIYLRLDAQVWVGGKEPARGKELARGEIEASGGIRHMRPEGALYLEAPRIERMRLDGIPAATLAPLQAALAEILSEHCAKHPIYVLDSQEHTFFTLELESITVAETGVVMTFTSKTPNPAPSDSSATGR
ncbi:MAG: DUF1439 domain-containing protein [Zoogloeaceae bacterium]|jgi:hypothetical protein|nr:DUF1439 domain-containing protein [Zoogloeaceae bacterium]